MKSPIKFRLLRKPGHSLEKQLQDLLYDDFLFPILGTFVFLVLAALEWLRWCAIRLQHLRLCLCWLCCFPLIRYGRWCGHCPRQVGSGRVLRESGRGRFFNRLIARDAAVLHDFSGVNLDDVVVHPSGVYYVETKTLSKPLKGQAKLFFGGDSVSRDNVALSRNPILQARYGAQWLRHLIRDRTGIDVPVRGVIVFPGWFIESSPAGRYSDVWALEPKVLPAFIKNPA